MKIQKSFLSRWIRSDMVVAIVHLDIQCLSPIPAFNWLYLCNCCILWWFAIPALKVWKGPLNHGEAGPILNARTQGRCVRMQRTTRWCRTKACHGRFRSKVWSWIITATSRRTYQTVRGAVDRIWHVPKRYEDEHCPNCNSTRRFWRKEVIELRKEIVKCGSENRHSTRIRKVKSSYQSMEDKNSTLERYIDRFEKQVGVQQNIFAFDILLR